MKLENIFKIARQQSQDKLDEFFRCVEKRLSQANIDGDFLFNLYITVYGQHFCEELAKQAVSHMENSDGSHGEHYSFEDACNCAKRMGIDFKNYNEWDWYFVLNMMYSDNYSIYKQDDISTFAKFAKVWLEDIDVPKGKAFRYWRYVVMENEIG